MALHPLKLNPVPSGAGTYALVIALDRSQHIIIGRRGGFHFPAGFYVYIGSALGPGGLCARIGRHLLAEKQLHWHIDFFLHSRARVVEAWVMESAARLECEWARAVAQWPGARIVVPRLGASDCRCRSHLIGFEKFPAPCRDPITFARVRIE